MTHIKRLKESYMPMDIVDVDRELEILWQKIYRSIKKILKMNGFVEEKPLYINNPESNILSDMEYVVLRNGNLFVKFRERKTLVFIEDLEDVELYNLYYNICKTVEHLQ